MKPIPVAFHFFGTPLVIHTYGIGLAITFFFGYRYFERRLRHGGYQWQWLTGVFVWVIVAAIIGARVVHVMANWHTGPLGPDYSAHPGDIPLIWNGGLSSFGGLIGGIPTGVILARRRCQELSTLRMLDLVAPVLMAAWGVGRLLGPQLMVAGGGHPTDAWFGMYYAGEVGKRLPVPIFQAILSFAIFGVLLLIERRLRLRPTGFVLAATASMWGMARFVEEHFWLSDVSSSGFDLVQAAGLALFVTGGVTMVVLWRRQARRLAAGASSPSGSALAPSALDDHSRPAPAGPGATPALDGPGRPEPAGTATPVGRPPSPSPAVD